MESCKQQRKPCISIQKQMYFCTQRPVSLRCRCESIPCVVCFLVFKLRGADVMPPSRVHSWLLRHTYWQIAVTLYRYTSQQIVLPQRRRSLQAKPVKMETGTKQVIASQRLVAFTVLKARCSRVGLQKDTWKCMVHFRNQGAI